MELSRLSDFEADTPPPDGLPYDLVGVGLGPFNLSLAALADGVPALRTVFLDAKPTFDWHPGLMIEGARMQVPFLADLVSLVDPTSPWSFLAYLRERQRLFPFYFAEQWHLTRREYEDYCLWAAEGLPNCRFDSPVKAVRWNGERRLFEVEVPGREPCLARHVVLGLGTEPVVPIAFAGLLGDGAPVLHSEDYLTSPRSPRALAGATDITVVGSGQSGAEVFLDLLRRRGAAAGPRLRWITRSAALAPMEYSKLGLEHFTPDYTRFFHGLSEPVRDALVPSQWQLYKAASAETLAAVHDALYERTIGAGGDAGVEIVPGTEVRSAGRGPCGGLELRCGHGLTGAEYALRTDLVVLATGYAPRRPALLDPMHALIDWDEQERYRVGPDYRVGLRPDVTGGLFVQNAELHTHGVGTPDLGLGAHRAAVILNAVSAEILGRTVHQLPRTTAWTTFGRPASATDLVPEQRGEWSDGSGRAGRSSRADRADQADRADHADRAGRSDLAGLSGTPTPSVASVQSAISAIPATHSVPASLG
ncbi:lysine N(6)-hydroxylase/L-ornithine N(5)-oxygenase family protein [Streptacidiphilus rugosus]|uniref:lysine N(6)-hydroxylase/L-ornithine N(5)-oxygenase family protein n=1 Tax=Streptacidiphilus rugosus TaxID=405783 RepID=UPI0022B2DBB7|nr:SidA/IucD/PvdA family monooxygenase [Streptacidiphilus rugosus]